MADFSSDRDEFAELYSEFNRFINGKDSEGYFSEDDLIDIFDYAGDIGDDTVRLEVLFYAQLKYRSSRRLMERKAIFYMNEGDDAGALRIARKLPAMSMIGRIILMRNGQLPLLSGSSDILDSLLNGVKPGAMSDEDVIQLIAAFDDLSESEVLYRNLARIKPLCEFPETFLYELAILLRNAGKYVEARNISAELTSMDAYNTDFWTLHAEICINYLAEYEEADAAIGYALAIDPDCIAALRLKHQLLFETHAEPADIEPVVDRICRLAPDDMESWYNRAVFMSQVGRYKEASSTLMYVLDVKPDFPGAADMLVGMTDGDLPDAMVENVKSWVRQCDFSEIRGVVTKYVHNSWLGAAITLLELYNDCVGFEDDGLNLLLETFCRAGRYDRVTELCRKLYPDMSDLVRNPVAALLYILSRKQLGDTDGLVDLVDMTLDNPAVYDADCLLDNQLKHIGCSYYLLQIKDAMTSKPDIDEAYYNPFAGGQH